MQQKMELLEEEQKKVEVMANGRKKMLKERDAMQYHKGMPKPEQRVASFQGVQLSVAERILVWNTYLITCLSYPFSYVLGTK